MKHRSVSFQANFSYMEWQTWHVNGGHGALWYCIPTQRCSSGVKAFSMKPSVGPLHAIDRRCRCWFWYDLILSQLKGYILSICKTSWPTNSTNPWKFSEIQNFSLDPHVSTAKNSVSVEAEPHLSTRGRSLSVAAKLMQNWDWEAEAWTPMHSSSNFGTVCVELLGIFIEVCLNILECAALIWNFAGVNVELSILPQRLRTRLETGGDSTPWKHYKCRLAVRSNHSALIMAPSPFHGPCKEGKQSWHVWVRTWRTGRSRFKRFALWVSESPLFSETSGCTSRPSWQIEVQEPPAAWSAVNFPRHKAMHKNSHETLPKLKEYHKEFFNKNLGI